MRSFGSGFNTKLSASSYLPVIFCKYELVTYVSGATAGTGTKTTTNYYWAERAITYSSQAYESRLVNTSPLQQSLDQSSQVFGELGLQIANSPTNLAGVIQAGMKCTVYLGFEDSAGSGTVTDAEVMFIGVVEGDIEITEDSVSFNLEDIAHTYDRQLPDLISREEYPFADPDSIGDTKPIIMGRVRDLECRAVASGFASVLAENARGRTYDDAGFIEGLPPIIDTEGDTSIYVTDDIGWWVDAFGVGVYPTMVINTVIDYETNESITGKCDISGVCSLTEFKTKTNCEGNDGTWTAYDTESICEANGGTWANANEEIEISSVEFDSSVNLWKLNLVEPLKVNHGQGDTIFQKDPCEGGTPNFTGYAYLVADHPVESITNVKVDGLPTAYNAITSFSGYGVCPDWDLPTNKAYIIVPTNAGGIGKTGGGGLEIEDTIAVDDKLVVEDDIDVDEDGHEHDTVGEKFYQHTLDYTYSHAVTGSFYIQVVSGNFSTFILKKSTTEDVVVNPTLTFTSNYPDVNVRFWSVGSITTPPLFFFLTVKGERIDNLGAVSNTVKSVSSSSGGNLLLKYVGGIGGTTNVKAGVLKIGNAGRTGDVTKTGGVKLVGGNSAADVLVGNKVTCDVIGICDGSTGYVKPHDQIKKFINKYARNPISGTEGSADIVSFSNESEMDTAFNKVYNTDDASKLGTSLYPISNVKATASLNPSPTADLGNTDKTEGYHAIDFAITEPNRFRDIVGDMLFHSNSTLNWQNGVAQIRHTGDAISKDATISKSDIAMQTMSLARSRASDLATDVMVRYDYSQAKDFARRFEYAEKSGTGDGFTKTLLDATRARGTHSKERSYDLPMARDQVTAEFVAKRLYDDKSAPKFESGVTTVLKNLAVEVGDYIDVSTPIYVNGVLDKGLVTSRTLEFGSAIDQTPDLIHLSVKENHTGDGFYLQTDTLTDNLAIADAVPTVTLNDVNTLFQSLTDTVTIAEGTIDVNQVQQLTDSLAITEAVSFDFELSLTDSLAITDPLLKFTGILFWDVPLSESLDIADSETTALRDSVYESGVYVETDLTTVGVFE